MRFKTIPIAIVYAALVLMPVTLLAVPNHPCEPWPTCRDGGEDPVAILEGKVAALETQVTALDIRKYSAFSV